MSGKIEINEDYCKSCGLCVSVCPKKILYIDKENINQSGYNPVNITDMDKCIGCANCALMCPDVVIKVERG